MNFNLPPYIKKIMAAFAADGYEAYVVGGAVRDLLLSADPHDYDLATNARPEAAAALCRKNGWQTADNLGGNFGCVLAVVDGMPVEITTFRGERYDLTDATEAHRPSSVWYCDTLREDLSRRDFTVNAMALDINCRLYDFFGGMEDLRRKVLRTVGSPRLRYAEDALRMLRACRFTAQLGFNYIQEEDVLPEGFGMQGTPYFLPQTYLWPVQRLSGVSLERVTAELDKLLTAPHAGKGLMLLLATGLASSCCRVKRGGAYTEVPLLPELQHLAGLPQNPRYHCYDVWEHTLLALDNAPRDLRLRWALLLHDIGKGLPGVRRPNPRDGQPSDPGHEAQSSLMTAEVLTRLGYNKKFTQLVVWLVAQHMRFAPMLLTGEKTLLRWVRAEATANNKGLFRRESSLAEAYSLLTEVFLADMGATNARHNPQLMAEGRELGRQAVELAATRMPIAPADLRLSGGELLEHVSQKQLPAMLRYLLARVQSGSLPNEKAALLAAAKKKLCRKDDKDEAL